MSSSLHNCSYEAPSQVLCQNRLHVCSRLFGLIELQCVCARGMEKAREKPKFLWDSLYRQST